MGQPTRQDRAHHAATAGNRVRYPADRCRCRVRRGPRRPGNVGRANRRDPSRLEGARIAVSKGAWGRARTRVSGRDTSAVAVILDDRMTPITVTTWPDESTRTPNSGCAWIAEATVEGRVYTARSRHGAPNELAPQLVAAGLAERPMVIRHAGLAGTLAYASFHATAGWTFNEGDRPLRRVPYREAPEGVFPGNGTGQRCVSSPAADGVVVPEPDPLKTGRRKCLSCDGDFLPARPCPTWTAGRDFA